MPDASIQEALENAPDLSESSPTGVVELNRILGGGIPERHTVLLAGSSGTGKTILSFQWLFNGVKEGENALYVTSTEPLFKTVRNIESLEFYDRDMLESEQLKVLDIRELYGFGENVFDPDRILGFIEKQVKETNAQRLCIDSITAIAYRLETKANVREFIFKLGKILASLGCTTILTSEVAEEDGYSMYGTEEFIADSIIKLTREPLGVRSERVLEIVKARGRGYTEEKLTFNITKDGIVAYPVSRLQMQQVSSDERISLGNADLDTLANGGVYRGTSTLVSGPPGAGKTTMGLQFVQDGLNNDEMCLYVSFEEGKEKLLQNARGFGWDFASALEENRLHMINMYPLEAYPEEHIAHIRDIVEEHDVQRVVVDSLSAVHDAFPEETHKRFLRNLDSYLKSSGVTSMYTASVKALVGSHQLSQSAISTAVDNAIMLRFAELEGELHHILNIVKMRASKHDKSLYLFDIDEGGIILGETLRGYSGVLSAAPQKVAETLAERIREEFRHYLGPMADQIFEDVREKGLQPETLVREIDDLTERGIIRDEIADEFKQHIERIFRRQGNVSEEEMREYFSSA